MQPKSFLLFFFLDKNTFCLLTNGFQSFQKFFCISPTSFTCEINLTFVGRHMSTSLVGLLLSFHANFYGGANVGGGGAYALLS